MDLLTELGTKYGTDKVNHKFTQVYDEYFKSIKDQKLNILEIGIWKGESLRMFKEYFPNSQIYAVDIEDKTSYKEDRINIAIGDQSNEEFLKTVFPGVVFDIILDDGSHDIRHQQISFEHLLPRLIPGGFYILEDLHTSTSAWPHLGGGDNKLDTTLVLLKNIKQKADFTNHPFFIKDIQSVIAQLEQVEVYATQGMNSITSVIKKAF